MIQPTTPITITLEAQQWEAAMRVLADGPYRVVAPLIATIQQQCLAVDRPNVTQIHEAGCEMSGTFSPGGPTFVVTVPYLRTSPVHVPRRDLVLSGADSLFLRVTVVESDNPDAQAIELTGGLGGPSAQFIVWPDIHYRTTWDYGAWPHCRPEPLWVAAGVISDAIGSFDFSFPSGTMMSWPRRCGWSVQLNYDTYGAEVLMTGTLHVNRMGKPYTFASGSLMTDDYLSILTSTGQELVLT